MEEQEGGNPYVGPFGKEEGEEEEEGEERPTPLIREERKFLVKITTARK